MELREAQPDTRSGEESNGTYLKALGGFIRERRHLLNITQRQLAERVGWTQERVSLVENGKYGMPSVPSLSHLAWALDSSLFELLRAAGFADAVMAQTGESQHAGAALIYALRRLLSIEATSLAEALDHAADTVADVLGADKVDAFIHEPASDTLVALGSSNTPMGRHQFTIGMNRMPIANGGREVEVFLTGNPYHSGRASDDPGMLVGVTGGLGVESLMTVPLDVAGTRRGVLVAESSRRDLFTPEDLPFLETVATFVGMVAQRAELAEIAGVELTLSARRLAAEELMTVLAHDLGNHLTPLKGHINVLRSKAEREERPDYLRSARAAERAIDRIQQLIGELLDASRLEQGLFTLSLQPTDLVGLVQTVVHEFNSEELPLTLDLPSDLVTVADPRRVRQALENLLSNAIRHSPLDGHSPHDGYSAPLGSASLISLPHQLPASQSSGSVAVVLSQETRGGADWAVIQVRDNGKGIPTEALPTLFTRFTKGTRSQGMGLGLYLARGIAEAHGGSLTVDSEVETGASFHLALPLVSRP